MLAAFERLTSPFEGSAWSDDVMYLELPFAGDPSDDAALLALALANPQARVELSHDGKILASPLTGSAVASKELAAALQLHAYARVAGGRAYGASAGFRLRDGSVFGPDAAWLSPERLEALRPADREATFWRVCPDVIVEVMSDSDSWPRLMRKIGRFIGNGAIYAVALTANAVGRFGAAWRRAVSSSISKRSSTPERRSRTKGARDACRRARR